MAVSGHAPSPTASWMITASGLVPAPGNLRLPKQLFRAHEHAPYVSACNYRPVMDRATDSGNRTPVLRYRRYEKSM